MMRILILILVGSILTACIFPPIGGNKPEVAEVPNEAIHVSPAIEITAPREELEPVKPRKAAPKPATSNLKNPLADCSDVDHLDDPKQATRARLDCMSERLEGRP